ncbi:hypothetical protein [Chlorogloeopsis sp. ULAP02]|uniref:hypothetical protein n=1 Tax=Chlorogloeopsis sp. ULAP02 TaxID=3107926 RepID=UPI00313599D2
MMSVILIEKFAIPLFYSKQTVAIAVGNYLQGEGIAVVDKTSFASSLIAVLPQLGQTTSVS